MHRLSTRFANLISSTRVAILILIALLVASLGRVLLPGTATSRYYGLLLATLLGALALSTAVCTVQRVLRRLKHKSQGPETLAFSHTASWEADPLAEGNLPARLQRKGFVLSQREDGIWVSNKSEWAWLASAGFHLGLVIFLMGAGINSLFTVKGVVMVPEGATVTVPQNLQIQQRGALSKNERGFNLTLQRLTPDYTGKNADQIESDIIFTTEEQVKPQTVLVNQPGRLGNWAILFRDWGYSPNITLSQGEKQLISNWLNLNSDYDNQQTKFKDVFPNVQEGLRLEIELFPDYVENEGIGSTKGHVPNNPYVYIKVLSAKGKSLFAGVVPAGGSLSQNGWTLEFTDLRLYETFDVVKDPGEFVIAFGAWLCAICGLIRAGYYTRRIWFKVESQGTGYVVAWRGWSEYFRLAFREEMTSYFEEGKQ